MHPFIFLTGEKGDQQTSVQSILLNWIKLSYDSDPYRTPDSSYLEGTSVTFLAAHPLNCLPAFGEFLKWVWARERVCLVIEMLPEPASQPFLLQAEVWPSRGTSPRTWFKAMQEWQICSGSKSRFRRQPGQSTSLYAVLVGGGSCRIYPSLAATMTFPDRFWDPWQVASFDLGL